MTPEVIKYIQKAQAIQLTPESDMKTILGKDAIYNAAGLASFNLFDEVDAMWWNLCALCLFSNEFQINFDEWFTQQLFNELKIGGLNFRILRRRVILLIGQWTSTKELRPQVYAACLHLLGANEDMCVRLAASKWVFIVAAIISLVYEWVFLCFRTLMTTMDDFEFDQETFQEFLEPSFALLFALLKDAKECDTKVCIIGLFVFDKFLN